MLYTLGRTEAYEWNLDNLADVAKAGRTADYPGGSVWRTREAAATYAATKPGYSVYGVIADWDRDTVPSVEGPWHDLLVDSLLVRISPCPCSPSLSPPSTCCSGSSLCPSSPSSAPPTGTSSL